MDIQKVAGTLMATGKTGFFGCTLLGSDGSKEEPMKTYLPEEIVKIKNMLKSDFTYWYHKIDLGNGIVTPGFNYDPLWDNIRKVRSRIDYQGKTVLDIASFDGLWAFEAEHLGAKTVVATDCLYRTFKNFMFCRDILLPSPSKSVQCPQRLSF